MALVAVWALVGTVSAQASAIVTQIDAGDDHTCVVTEARTAICWGRNDDGQSNAAESTLTYVSAGAKHSCALASGNRVVCWGSDSYGQQMQDFNASSNETLHQVSAGSRNTCVHYAGVFGWCEGDASHLTIGSWFNLRGSSAAPQAVGVGEKHACWLTDGFLTCRGDNVYGQIDSPSERGYRQLAVGANHNCARDQNGTVECWGRNRHAQTAVPTSVKFLDVAAGASHTCGVRDSNELQCWGLNDSGQTNVVAGDTWSLVTAGGSHSCAVNESGKVACWGDNSHGQLNVPAAIAASGVQTTSGTSADPVSASGDELTAYFPAGRIVARRLDDGRTEFGYHPQGGQRILPTSRYFPADATVGAWLNSSAVIVDGEEAGRINARLLADGRIEFSFTPSGDERILPSARYFPVSSSSGGWLRSSLIGSD